MADLKVERLGIPHVGLFESGPAAFFKLELVGATHDEIGETVTIITASEIDLERSPLEWWSAARTRILDRLEEAARLVRAAEAMPIPEVTAFDVAATLGAPAASK